MQQVASMVRDIKYWKESTLTRHKIWFYNKYNEGIAFKHFLDDELFEKFVAWVDVEYRTEPNSWMLEDWVNAYIVFDNALPVTE